MFLGNLKTFLHGDKVFLLALSLIIPTTLFAEEAVDIGTISVVEKPTSISDPSLGSAAAATVITPEDNPDPTVTIPTLLQESAGVNIKRYGGLDDFSVISLRGSSADQVGIYLDDVPLDTAQGNITDLTLIPTNAIQKIEVYRGGAPGMMPDSSAGGVVVMKTKPLPEKQGFDGDFTYGSFNTAKTRINLKGPNAPIEKVGFRLSFEHDQSRGDFTYKDNNGTPANPNDDQIVKRLNNDHNTIRTYGTLGIKITDDSTLTISDILFRKDQGVPGLSTRTSLNARLTTARNITWASYDAPKLFSDTAGVRATLFVDWLSSEFFDPLGEIGLGQQNSDDNTVRVGDQATFSAALGNFNLLKGLIAHRSEFYMPTNKLANPQSGPTSTRHRITTAVEDEILLFAEQFIIEPSARLETIFNHLTNQDPSIPSPTIQQNRSTDIQASGKLGLVGIPTRWIKLKANLYRGYRPPSFSELFGNQGTIVGNATLIAEQSLNVDAGFSIKLPKKGFLEGGYVEAFYFRNDIDNLIQYVQTSQFTVRAMNMNRALVQGAEFATRINFDCGAYVRAAYTYQHAKDKSGLPATDGKFIPGRPMHQLNAGAAWRWKWNEIITSDIFTTLDYMSGNYLDTQNLVRVDNRTIFGSGVVFTFIDHIDASFSVRNITNDRISDLVGYPLPGRSYWGNIGLRI
ncbi:MAG: TonB-dependent receptor [Deltaproteobacteria bacterium]|jgi:outer membrane receptor protein involved in Fe transport|nr:TonB-dependent receptor [Deltaproteobacteria bacterium]